jgi:chorismate mutase / prephenate dehydratase
LDTQPNSLDELRKRIDEFDQILIDAINQRAKIVVEIGNLKRSTGQPIYTPHREAEVLKKVQRLNTGPIHDKTIEAVYRELMSGSFALEQPLRIGYLGPMGTYSHVAAQRHFGSSVEFENLHAIEGIFEEVARGHVDYGLVPIENNIGGGISETLDVFLSYHDQVNVYGEIQLATHYSLLTNCEPHEVTHIFSKPEVLTQCRHWVATQYPNAQITLTETTAAAAQKAQAAMADGSVTGAAAIGSSLAGEIYGLHVLFEQIEDRRNHIARYLILSNSGTEVSGDDKTSLMFTTDDRPGALVDVLNVFKRAGVNLTHIDKRPSLQVNWEYTFFLDAVGHRKELGFAEVIGEARAFCRHLYILGSYPRSKRVL